VTAPGLPQPPNQPGYQQPPGYQGPPVHQGPQYPQSPYQPSPFAPPLTPAAPPGRGGALKWIALGAVVVVLLCGAGGLALLAVGRVAARVRADAQRARIVQEAPSAIPASPPVSSSPSGGASATEFGSGYGSEWDDHVRASVLGVIRFTPSNTVDDLAPGDVPIKVTVKIVNGSGAPLDLSGASVDVNADGTDAEAIDDSAIGSGFDGTLRPGGWATAVYAFAVPASDLGRVDVSVQPAADYTSAVFEGPVTG
jgi:hypothetical protein